MNINTLICAALVTTAIFTSCEERTAANKQSPSLNHAVVITINGEEVYQEKYLEAPDEMIKIFNRFCDIHFNKDDRHIDIELKYILEQEGVSLVDSYCGISYEKRPSSFPSLAITNDPNWEQIPNELRPSYDVAMSEIREQAEKTFYDWWNRKKLAEQGGTGQPATRPESKSDASYKPQPESEGRSR